MAGRIGRRWSGRLLSLMVVFLLLTTMSPGYSVLTHEAIVDSVWKSSIKPLLLARFPAATEAELKEAHAYAYGGCIIQDMGYFPFGNRLYSNLVHYVRSGRFAGALIQESQDINEYAFALGALSHYAADNSGHPLGTNRSVAILYPKLKQKYGDVVTYENDPSAHLKTEFGFDVLQVANGAYASAAYHDFIGFKVSKPVLERAFKDTYGIELKDMFLDLDLSIGTYRRSVSSVIPRMTRLAWDLRHDEISKQTPGITREQFRYNLNRKDYERDWGTSYKAPGIFARTTAFFLVVVPKVGPFKSLAFKPPVPETEKLLKTSFDVTISRYKDMLAEVSSNRLNFANEDLDTGNSTSTGEYGLADKAYADLLHRLAEAKFANVTADLRDDILTFYGNGSAAPPETKSNHDDWKKTMAEVSNLRAYKVQEVVVRTP